MSSRFENNGVALLPASEVGKLFGYTSDYVARLAREGKVAGEKIGRQWHVSPNSVEAFVEESEKTKQERAEAIRQERLAERAQHTTTVVEKVETKTPVVSKSAHGVSNPVVATETFIPQAYQGGGTSVATARKKSQLASAVAQTVAVFIVGIVVGNFLFQNISYQNNAATVYQAANVSSDLSFFEQLAYSVYTFFNPASPEVMYVEVPDPRITAEPKAAVVQTESVESATITAGEGAPAIAGVVILPLAEDGTVDVTALEGSFSDDVTVYVDPENPTEGIIIPDFKSGTKNPYGYTVVPITSNEIDS